MMIKRLKSLNYHKELIEILLKNKQGAVATNLIGPIIYFLLFYQFIPYIFLFTWVFMQFILIALRFFANERLLANLYTANDQQIKQQLKLLLFTIFSNSFLWGISTLLAIIYADEAHVFILVAALFAILAGSISTLSSVYHAVFIYTFNIVFISLFSFIFIGATETYYFTSLLFAIHLIVHIPTSFRVYSIMNDSILQKEEIKILNDSLELKVANAINETAKKEKLLQQQTRLAQMGEMINMIAHQWRQPLGAISSAVFSVQTKLLTEKFDLKEPQGRTDFLAFLNNKHENINNYVQVLTTTIDDFRNFFKTDKTKEIITLTTPINRALYIVSTSMNNKGIEIITDFQSDKKIPLYRNEMMQVILNILKNAEDNFMDLKTQQPVITIITRENNDKLLIKITDNGGGIKEHILPKIFDPYFSTKEGKNGTGLGLYMSKIIVEEHNDGLLNVKNKEQGVCFEISFQAS